MSMKRRYRRPVLVYHAKNGGLVASFPSLSAVEKMGFDLRSVCRSIETGRPHKGLIFRDAFPAAPTTGNAHQG